MYALIRKRTEPRSNGEYAKKRKGRKKYDQDYKALPKDKRATTFCKRKDGIIKKLIQLGLLIPGSDFYCMIRNENGAQYCAFSKRYKSILKLVSLVDEGVNNKLFSDVVSRVDTGQKYYHVCKWLASYVNSHKRPSGITKQQKTLHKQLLEKKMDILRRIQRMVYEPNDQSQSSVYKVIKDEAPVRFWTNSIDKYICNYNFFEDSSQQK
jgi:hypothetical protein